ncbi:hypothetical protein BH10PSE15_BH10PSE15_06080 [soil metagenome]
MYRLLLSTALLFAGSAALSADHGRAAREAVATQARLDTALAGLVPGKPQQCLELSGMSYETERIGDTILYKLSRQSLVRADTTGGCNGLDRGDAIVTHSFGSQLCAGDLIRTLDLTSHIPSGACTIRSFVPYRAPKP